MAAYSLFRYEDCILTTNLRNRSAPRSKIRLLLTVALIWLPSLFSSPACRADEPAQPIPQLVIGAYLPALSDEVNMADIKITLEFWLGEISREFHVTDTHAVFFDDINSLHDAFAQRRVDIIIAPPLEIVRHFNLAMLAAGLVGATNTDSAAALTLLVDKRHSAEFKKLRGKRLLLPEGDELARVYADVLTLRHAGEPAKQFFTSVTARKHNSRLILDLFFGQVDAVIVYRSFFEVTADLNPQIRQQLAVLESYPLRSKNFAFFHRDYPYAGLVLPVLDRFAATPRGRQVLEIFKCDKLAASTVADLMPIIDLDKEYSLLKQRRQP